MKKQQAVFLDRDGVLIKDIHLLTDMSQVRLYPDSSEAVKKLHDAGYILIVVTNQPVVARGLATEQEVTQINEYINSLLKNSGQIGIDKFYICPHHPNATLVGYRVNCNCRKPRPGMLLQAAEDLNLDLHQSYLVGDRISDIIAGSKAGCTTIQVQTGMHEEAPIQSDALDMTVEPDYMCPDLITAANKIVDSEL